MPLLEKGNILKRQIYHFKRQKVFIKCKAEFGIKNMLRGGSSW